MAFGFTDAVAGTALEISVYVAPGNAATVSSAKAIVVGLYADARGRPGLLLASGSARVAAGGGWVTAAIRGTTLVPGHAYWTAVLGTGGTLTLRAGSSAACKSTVTGEPRLAALPRAWAASAPSTDCVTAYVSGRRRSRSRAGTGPAPSAPSGGTSAPSGGSTTGGSTSGGSTSGGSTSGGSGGSGSGSYAPPVDTALPAISGAAGRGRTLTSSPGSWSNSPTSYAYQWQDCTIGLCLNIPNAIATGYTAQVADVGDSVDVVVTASNPGGLASATSAQTATVVAAPVDSAVPVITGTAAVGDTLTASTGTWSNTPTSYAYQWQDCTSGVCVAIPNATGASYTAQLTDVGDSVDVVVTATNAAGLLRRRRRRPVRCAGGAGGFCGAGDHGYGGGG